jgi:hypothetical protein
MTTKSVPARLECAPARGTLHGPLRARLNRLAHAKGLAHAAAYLVSVTDRVQRARDAGATYDELDALVTKIEQGGF